MSSMNPYLTNDWSNRIIEAAPRAVVMIDRERRIRFVNRSTERLFGYDRAELIGAPVEMLVPERLRANHPALVESFFSQPRSRAMGAGREIVGRRKDGTEVQIEIDLNPVETAEGILILAAISDVTERRRSEDRFRIVVEAAPSGMLMLDRTRRITLVNRKLEELFGYERNELVGQLVEMLVPDRFRAMQPRFMEVYLADPKAPTMGTGRELFGRRKDGSEIPIEIGLTPLETAEGLFTLASIIDISERKCADSAQQRLAAIVEGSDDAIVSKTLDGTITSWNRGAERLFGYRAEEAIGQSGSILIPDRLKEEELRLIERIRSNQRVDPFETVRRCKDGSELDVSLSLSPVRNSAGEVVGAAKIARDITELKRRDAELKRSNAELEQFAYVASHDLQEPLRMVANYTELLAERYRGRLDEKADKYIHYASDGARRMQRLVNDLLTYSRVGSQGKPLVPVSSQEVLQGVLRSIQPLLRESGAQIEYDELPMVTADEVQLRQLFQNLIGNAIKFRSEAPPRIVIRAVPDGGSWRFSVADNGIGIEMKYADRIFQMFQRLHEIGKYEGSGIGLAIVKRIVERHAGRIWVESQPSAGATFFFTLRAARKVKHE